jgi:hypothetical protein
MPKPAAALINPTPISASDLAFVGAHVVKTGSDLATGFQTIGDNVALAKAELEMGRIKAALAIFGVTV